ncbi:uncharacterized protein LOC134840678 [Symsagittifera roscoffensis]|uniref:uncharacterized protein LOC134840678 n=1 Tax=Symsagittifera roscoffensis TaxID=84072 RepID=UPI00307B8DCA
MGNQLKLYKGRTSRCVGYLGAFVSFLITVYGGAMTGMGVWLVSEDVVGVLKTVVPSSSVWDWIAFGMIVTGVFLSVTGLLGIKGFIKERRMVLTLHCLMLALSFVGVSLFVGLPMWYRSHMTKNLYNQMEESFFDYQGEQARDKHSVFWNYAQIYVSLIVVLQHCLMLALSFVGVSLFVGLPMWYRSHMTKNLYNQMEESFFDYQGEQARDKHSVFWNYAQIYYRCCGLDQEADWRFQAWNYENKLNIMYMPSQGRNISRRWPASCCDYYTSEKRPSLNTIRKGRFTPDPVKVEDCYRYNPNSNPPASHTDGCYRKFKSIIYSQMTFMGTTASVLCVKLLVLFLKAVFVIMANAPEETRLR